MTKTAISANGEAMPVSRRHLLGAALAGTAVSAVAFVPTAVKAMGRGYRPGLRDLVEAHRHATEQLNSALLEMTRALAHCEGCRSTLIPTMISPDGRVQQAAELEVVGAWEIQRDIQATHAKLRSTSGSAFGYANGAGPAHDMAAAIEASEAACLAALDRATAVRRQREDEMGFTAASDLYDVASASLDAATLAILAHIPANASEAAAKRDWLLQEVSRRDYALTKAEFEALAASIAA